MTATNAKLRSGVSLLERPAAARTIGIWIVTGLSLATLLLSLPFVNWFTLTNLSGLWKALSIPNEAVIYSGYSAYNLLSFVQQSGAGILGFPASMLLLVTIAAALFQAAFLFRVAFKRYGNKGYLQLYSTGTCAMILSIIASFGAIAYLIFANARLGITWMLPSPMVCLVPVLSIAAYVVLKAMQKTERVRQHEHGFLVEFKRNWLLFLFLVPCFAYFIINNYLPMSGVYFAFTQFNFRDGLFASPFVGFKNFEFLFMSDLWKLTKNTVLYNIVFIGLGNVLQIFFAILVSQVGSKWFKKTSQTMIFMPYFVSFVILRVLVYNLFEYDYGVINTYVTALGGSRIDFYNTPKYWPFLIVAFNMWKGLGYGMVVYLATIMGISDDYYDAAKVDGANIFQQIIYITVPLLTPTFIILLLYALGGIMKGQFELFYQMVGTNGVLYDATDILDTYVYRITTSQPLSMGLATAAGLYQSVFGLVIIVVTNFCIKRGNPEYALF